MNLHEKIGQLFTPAAYIHDTEENILVMERLITEQGIGGITFFHSRHSAAANFEQRQEQLSYEQTLEKLIALINRYQALSKIPLLISIDAEFGLAMRIEDTPHYPFAIAMGALTMEHLSWVEAYGERIGRDLKACGIHLNFAPVADINTNPKNPVIGYRSFGTDREKVSAFALACFQGMKKAGIAACYKHFPGHGDTAVDSHLGLPIINKSKAVLLEEELYPFIQGIAAGIDMIMVGHLAIPSLTKGESIPATISKAIITGLLRQELGFDGIVVSDALNMKAVANMFSEPGQLEFEAFAAGTDLLCFSEHVAEGIAKIVQFGNRDQIERSFERIQELKTSLGLLAHTPLAVPSFDFQGVHAFNKQLAKKYIHVFHRRSDLDQISVSAGLIIGPIQQNHFGKDARYPVFHSIDELMAAIPPTRAVTVSLFVPSAKPVKNFGLEMSDLENLDKLTRHYLVDLYLFGNPLCLRLIPSWEAMRSITLAYHGFEENQQVVIEAFGG
jgi:beta-N-acetylhexosaminidase